jgi:hypothetical protein
MPSLNQKILDRLPIWLPEIEEQQKIAAVLSVLDAKIGCNKCINAELETMAKTLYDYWFVQFDFPFDFAQGRLDANGKPYKSSGGKMVYNPTLKREIPAGWKDGTLNDLGRIVGGSTPTTENPDNFTANGTPWITDIYTTALDYDPSASVTKRFFAAVQNKLHYAIHGQTAAEVIVDRADHRKESMGLTHWEDAPKDKIHKYDVAVAKNYLSAFELAQMQRIVSAYLDMAEMQAMRKMPMTTADWEEHLGGFLKLWDREVLQDADKVTAEIAKAHAESEFEKYRIVQDRLYESDFDRVIKLIESSGQLDVDEE